MFTKQDKQWLQQNFATKDDLKKLVTKDDAKNFATKDDLKDLAKQKDLLVVKDDLKKLEKKLDKKFTDLFDLIDKDVMENKRKIKTIEQILRIPSVS